jgi:rubredoxin
VKLLKKYECKLCGFIYDETQGDPDFPIDPGTVWEDVSDDYVCPLCGAGKEEFELIED